MATSSPSQILASPAESEGARAVSVLLYSDDITTRDAVRAGVGSRPSRTLTVTSWRECATAPAVIEAIENGTFDLVILDGEAVPVGGMGLCRQLKNEIFDCPPVILITGRSADVWLAAWSLADEAVAAPFDSLTLVGAVRSALGD